MLFPILRPRVGLDVGEGGAEQLLGTVDGQLLDHVDVLAAAVVAPPRVALGVLVRRDTADRLQDGARYEVLRRDHLERVPLACELAGECGGDVRPGVVWFGEMLPEDVLRMATLGSAEVLGVAYSFSQPIQMRMDDLLQGVRGDVAIKLYGDDLKVLASKADEIVKQGKLPAEVADDGRQRRGEHRLVEGGQQHGQHVGCQVWLAGSQAQAFVRVQHG